MSDHNFWLLGCPAPAAGSFSQGIYNAGPMIADDREGPTAEDSQLQIVSGISEKDCEDYRRLLSENGIHPYFKNRLGQDRFFVFSLNGQDYHVQHSAKRAQLRIIQGPAHTGLKDFGYQHIGSHQTTLYQYGLYYDPDNNMTEKTANCGMLYIVKLSDNSLFMIDGGYYLQWNEESAAALWQFLLNITGTPADGTVRIAGWYFTHTHADHIDGCVKLLNRHHDQIKLERLLYNFPFYSAIGGYEPSAFHVKDMVHKWYPEIRLLKLHTGQAFQLADMTVEVLYTQEDSVSPEALSRFPMRDSNCASSILRLTVEGKTLMILGDTNIESEDFIVRFCDREYWKSDMVQLAHHCFNFLDTLYEWIAAPFILVPNSYGGAHQPENAAKLAGAEKYLKNGQIYYEGGGTDAFTVSPTGWIHAAHYPLAGGEYDGSGY